MSCRVDVGDVLSAVSYSLRAEVPLHVLISGSAYFSLLNYVSLLEQVRRPFTKLTAFFKIRPFPYKAFTGVSPKGASASLRAVRERLAERNQAGFITNKEWHRIMSTKVGVERGVASFVWLQWVCLKWEWPLVSLGEWLK